MYASMISRTSMYWVLVFPKVCSTFRRFVCSWHEVRAFRLCYNFSELLRWWGIPLGLPSFSSERVCFVRRLVQFLELILLFFDTFTWERLFIQRLPTIFAPQPPTSAFNIYVQILESYMTALSRTHSSLNCDGLSDISLEIVRDIMRLHESLMLPTMPWGSVLFVVRMSRFF